MVSFVAPITLLASPAACKSKLLPSCSAWLILPSCAALDGICSHFTVESSFVPFPISSLVLTTRALLLRQIIKLDIYVSARRVVALTGGAKE